jgi:Glycosyl hydrolase family 71
MTLPFTMPDPFGFQKKVFAHYFQAFPQSIDNLPAASDYYETQYLTIGGESGKHAAYGGYLRARPMPLTSNPNPAYQVWSQANMETEVGLAIARGITGFTFDILSYPDAISPTGRLETMLAAALAVDPRFKIMPMIDMSTAYTPVEIQTILASLNSIPSVMREPDGRMVFSAFNAVQPLSFWQPIIQSLNAQNVNVAFIPIFLGNPPTVNPLGSISIGAGGWGTAIPTAASGSGCYMTPILTQQFRPKNQIFWESSNYDTFRASWAAALASNGPYAQIITWSDFSESGQVQPHTDATLALNLGTGFYDLTAYYATWFMSGSPPPITQDRIYWCYRRMSSTVAHPNQPDAFTVVGPPAEVENIEALAFLTAPGTILINGSATQCPAGITSVKVPSAPGQPTLALQRNGSNVFQGSAPIAIYNSSGSPAGTLDLTYWSGSLPS